MPSLPLLTTHYCSFPGKIEIKIVRPGAEGNEEDTRWLTDEDTKNLKEIFFNILVRHPTHVLGPQLPRTVLLRSRSGYASRPLPASRCRTP